MKAALASIVLAACWTGKSPPPPAPARTFAIPRTADAFVHRVIGAIAGGDTETLVQLTKVTAPSLACAGPESRELSPERMQVIEELVRMAASMHAELKVLGFKDEPQDMIVRARRGPSCDNIPVTLHDLTVDLQLRLDGHDRRFPVRAMLYAEVVDGQWFLAVQPIVPLQSAAARDRLLAPTSAAVLAACTCRDAACFAAASQGYRDAMQRLDDAVTADEEPDKTIGADEHAQWNELDARLAKCGQAWATP